jgi:hypothetical protein
MGMMWEGGGWNQKVEGNEPRKPQHWQGSRKEEEKRGGGGGGGGVAGLEERRGGDAQNAMRFANVLQMH